MNYALMCRCFPDIRNNNGYIIMFIEIGAIDITMIFNKRLLLNVGLDVKAA